MTDYIPIKCPHCGNNRKDMIYIGARRQNTETHKEEQMYHCEVCSKDFIRKEVNNG